MKCATSSGENKQVSASNKIKAKPNSKRKQTFQIEDPVLEISNKYQCLSPEENYEEDIQSRKEATTMNKKDSGKPTKVVRLISMFLMRL